jgi:anti-sigma B factor antagonist
MRIIERRVGTAVVLDFVGRLYGWQASELIDETVRRHRLAGTQTLVVNLGLVTAVDCGGLGALVEARNTMRQVGGEIRLACVTARICDLLVITRLVTVFDTFESVARALEGPISTVPALIGSAALAALPAGVVFQQQDRASWPAGSAPGRPVEGGIGVS